MKLLTLLLTLWTGLQTTKAQTLYSKSYGDSNKPPIIYIHGGPRGNSTLFEGTTAQKLANKGFYVIVYDRRGEGRSIDTLATFTFQEAFDDLNQIMTSYQLTKANLIGHSFGGIVATLFTDKYPEKVNKLMLAGALFSQQETYNHILKTVSKQAKKKSDKETLLKIAAIEKMDRNSADYRKQCYEVASKYSYFSMPQPTESYERLNTQYKQGEFGKNNIRNDKAPILFYNNETQVNIDTKPVLKNLKHKGVELYALYGLQDGIFSRSQLKSMRKITGQQRFEEIENCSHYPFVDQQDTFIQIIESWMKL